jgi:Flp pilus assembly protein TadG
MMGKSDSERGATLITVALMLMTLMAFLALVVDVGAGYVERRRIQSVADAAAFAGVQVLNENKTDAQILAAVRNYALVQNVPAGNETRRQEDITVEWMVGPTPSGNVGQDGRPANVTGILVTIRGSTPTFFANILGITTVNASATGGGGYSPLDVMLVLDRSGSMEYNSCNFERYFATSQPCRNLIGTFATEYERIEQIYSNCDSCRGSWQSWTNKCFWPNNTLMSPAPAECAAAGVTTQNGCTACQGRIVQPYQPMADVKNAASGFVGLVQTELAPTFPHMGVVSYSDSATLERSLTGTFSFVQTAITNIARPNGRTNCADGLSKALTEVTGPNHRPTAIKVIVFMTDGQCNLPGSCSGSGPCAAARDAAITQANNARAAKVIIYTIGLGTGADTALLQQITTLSGGTAAGSIYAPTTAQLAAAYEALFEQIKRLRLVQ